MSAEPVSGATPDVCLYNCSVSSDETDWVQTTDWSPGYSIITLLSLFDQALAGRTVVPTVVSKLFSSAWRLVGLCACHVLLTGLLMLLQSSLQLMLEESQAPDRHSTASTLFSLLLSDSVPWSYSSLLSE